MATATQNMNGASVTVEQDYIVIRLPKLGKPVKEFGLKETGTAQDGTKTYEVPKNHLYGTITHRIPTADGRSHQIQANWTLPATEAERVELFEAAKLAGLNVTMPEASKPRQRRAAMTAASLKGAMGAETL